MPARLLEGVGLLDKSRVNLTKLMNMSVHQRVTSILGKF